MIDYESKSLIRELELRLESKHNALVLAVRQRDEAIETADNLRAQLAGRPEFPKMLGGWF
jgi:hypothetical protein